MSSINVIDMSEARRIREILKAGVDGRVRERKALQAVEYLRGVLWPNKELEDEDEWTEETATAVARVLVEAGFGPDDA